LFRKQSSQEGFHLRHIDLSVTISSIGRIECFEVWIAIIDNLIGVVGVPGNIAPARMESAM